MPQHTGLGLDGRDDRIAGLKVLDVWRPTAAARPRVMLVECQIRSVTRPDVDCGKSLEESVEEKRRCRRDWQDRLDAADWLGRTTVFAALQAPYRMRTVFEKILSNVNWLTVNETRFEQAPITPDTFPRTRR